MERIFISWIPSSTRSQLLANEFNAKAFYVKYLAKKNLFHTFARYFIAMFHTVFILYKTKPKFVFVMNLPVFLPMVVYLYTRINTDAHYIIDSHSTMFNRTIWKKFIPVMKIVYRKSFLNIAHTDYDAKTFESWGVKTAVMYNDFCSYASYEKAQLHTDNNIVVIASYSPDEPIHEIILAAEELQNIHFYITGSAESAKRFGIGKVPKNVTLTGFLPVEEFIGLLKSADAALILVNTDNTMQAGAWEALSCETPIIITDWPLLKTAFPMGAVYVKNSKTGIQDGVTRLFKNKNQLKDEIIRLKGEKIELHEKEVYEIENILNSSFPSRKSG
jgi:glycosyltransferase involved in cell wall biosynthesis